MLKKRYTIYMVIRPLMGKGVRLKSLHYQCAADNSDDARKLAVLAHPHRKIVGMDKRYSWLWILVNIIWCFYAGVGVVGSLSYLLYWVYKNYSSWGICAAFMGLCALMSIVMVIVEIALKDIYASNDEKGLIAICKNGKKIAAFLAVIFMMATMIAKD